MSKAKNAAALAAALILCVSLFAGCNPTPYVDIDPVSETDGSDDSSAVLPVPPDTSEPDSEPGSSRSTTAKPKSTTAAGKASTTRGKTTTTAPGKTTAAGKTTAVGKTTTAAKKPLSPEQAFNDLTPAPLLTNAAAIDTAAENLISGLTGSLYERMGACYDYVMSGFTSGNPTRQDGNDPYVRYVSAYDKTIVDDAAAMLAAGQGNSYNAGALLMVLFRRLGLEAYVVGGTVARSNSRVSQAWVTVKAGGKTYVFAPYYEKTVPAAHHAYFACTYESTDGIFAYDEGATYNTAKFRHFLCYPEDILCTLSVTVGGKTRTATLGHQGDYEHLLDWSAFTDDRGVFFGPNGVDFTAEPSATLSLSVALSGGSGNYTVQLYQHFIEDGASGDRLLKKETVTENTAFEISLKDCFQAEDPLPTEFSVKVQDAVTGGVSLHFTDIMVSPLTA